MGVSRGGGKPEVGGVNDYQSPKGPKDQGHVGPGLGGDNYGVSNRPTGGATSGSPGLGGDNCGNNGTQGRH